MDTRDLEPGLGGDGQEATVNEHLAESPTLKGNLNKIK